MLKLKSQSLVVSEYEENVLRNHLEKLVEQSEEKINRKLQQQQQKQARLNALEKKFVEQASQKEKEIQLKLEKSTKNKEEHVNSIVKKCKDHDKYLGEKLRNYQNKKRASMREAWKISEKYKEFVDERELQKNPSESKSIFNKQASGSRLLNRSFQKKEQITRLNEEHKRREFRVSFKKTNHSVKYLRLPDSIHNLAETNQEKEHRKAREQLQMTLDRFRKNNVEAQQSKIQQLGKRLQKIEQGRFRKLDLIKKKKQNHSNYLHHKRKDRKIENTQRVHSEQSKVRERRTRDWSQATKNKRAEFFEAHLQNGNEYLSNEKLKFIKTKLAKKIVNTAIQKKLYFQRLHH